MFPSLGGSVVTARKVSRSYLQAAKTPLELAALQRSSPSAAQQQQQQQQQQQRTPASSKSSGRFVPHVGYPSV